MHNIHGDLKRAYPAWDEMALVISRLGIKDMLCAVATQPVRFNEVWEYDEGY